MSEKIILNDNEVVFNEDVSSIQDWRDRDLGRALEALSLGSYQAQDTLVAGAVRPAAIVSGLGVTGSLTNLDITIGTGLLLCAFGGSDTSYENPFRLAAAKTLTSLTLPPASPTLYRWDLVEVSAEKVTATELRKVLTASGPTRRLVDTLVPKTISFNLKFRVRSGTPDTLTAARLPVLAASDEWIPLYGIRVNPAALTLFGAKYLDLRKFWAYHSPAFTSGYGGENELLTRVSMLNAGSLVFVSPNWVRMSGYTGPLQVSPTQLTSTTRPNFDINMDKAATLTLAGDVWYYVYAYRPTSAGFTAMLLSATPPIIGSATPSAPSTALTPPAPWDLSESLVGHYLGSVRVYDSGGGIWKPKQFRQNGGYVVLSSQSRGGETGATDSNILFNGVLSVGDNSVNLNSLIGGIPTVPSHVRGAKVALSLTSSGSSQVNIVSSEDFILWESPGLTIANGTVVVTLDIPFPAGAKTFIAAVTGDSVELVAETLGYYEELP